MYVESKLLEQNRRNREGMADANHKIASALEDLLLILNSLNTNVAQISVKLKQG